LGGVRGYYHEGTRGDNVKKAHIVEGNLTDLGGCALPLKENPGY
jgi:hypothetical protein